MRNLIGAVRLWWLRRKRKTTPAVVPPTKLEELYAQAEAAVKVVQALAYRIDDATQEGTLPRPEDQARHPLVIAITDALFQATRVRDEALIACNENRK